MEPLTRTKIQIHAGLLIVVYNSALQVFQHNNILHQKSKHIKQRHRNTPFHHEAATKRHSEQRPSSAVTTHSDTAKIDALFQRQGPQRPRTPEAPGSTALQWAACPLFTQREHGCGSSTPSSIALPTLVYRSTPRRAAPSNFPCDTVHQTFCVVGLQHKSALSFDEHWEGMLTVSAPWCLCQLVSQSRLALAAPPEHVHRCEHH